MSKKQISWGFLLMFILTLVLATKLTPHLDTEITQKQNKNYSPLNLPIAFASSKPFVKGLAVDEGKGQLPQVRIKSDQLPKIKDIKLTLTNDEKIVVASDTISRQTNMDVFHVGKSNSQIAEEARIAQQEAEARLAYLNSLREKNWMPLIMSYFPESQWNSAYKIMMAESKGNPNAVSWTGCCKGLFQINVRDTWRSEWGNVFDPEQNVRGAFLIWSSRGWSPWSTKYILSSSVSGKVGTIKKIKPSNLQCLQYVHQVTGRTYGVMYPIYLKPNSYTPRIGAAALHTYNHISYVVGVGKGYIIILEANYLKGWIIQRVVNPREIRGYII